MAEAPAVLADTIDAKLCLAAGMNGHLSKPVGKDALLAAVTRFVERDGRTSRTRPRNPPEPMRRHRQGTT